MRVAYNLLVELASNLLWAVASVFLLTMTWLGVRRGAVKLSMFSAMTMALLLCFILLPVISMSDDLLEQRQAALPLSGQTWRLATEGVAAGLDQLVAVGVLLLLLFSFMQQEDAPTQDQWSIRPIAARLARSQRLRPPPPDAV
jgi:amino acid transporter